MALAFDTLSAAVSLRGSGSSHMAARGCDFGNRSFGWPREAPRNLRAWMFATVRNAALDAIKAERRRGARDKRAGESRLPLFVPNPAASITAEEIQAAATLRHRCAVLVLRLWTDSTFQEIAELTHMPLSSIISFTNRAANAPQQMGVAMQDMNNPDNLSNEEKAFADSLAVLKPVRPEISRDALLFEAGRASVPRRSVWPWQAATGASLAFALCMLVMMPLHSHAPGERSLRSPLHNHHHCRL